ncbi:D-sedoheptulose 7-phosphate isomerase [Lachnospiraceae bacterium 48-21]
MYIIHNTSVFQEKVVRAALADSASLKKRVAQDEGILNAVAKISEEIAESLKNGGKILVCGNGGSASDALHFCGEIVGRFQKERRGFPAIALNADVASVTSIANDYGYGRVFERSVEAYMNPEDILIGISTSGNSENIYRAVVKAKELSGKTVGLLGKTGGKIAGLVDYPIVVPSDVTARVQECHICIIHTVCDLVERML